MGGYKIEFYQPVSLEYSFAVIGSIGVEARNEKLEEKLKESDLNIAQHVVL